MINISKLYCGGESQSDTLRYGHQNKKQKNLSGAPIKIKSAAQRHPVVVWNVTKRCNLHCVHCYTDSKNRSYDHELTTQEGEMLIQDLARFKIPALLFSGGEPLMRKDLFHLVQQAVQLGIRPTLSTNGVLIDQKMAQKIKHAGFTYVGISLDGIGEVNDRFRGKKGAFDRAIKGFRNCREIEQRVGLRLTLTRQNFQELDKIFDFIEQEGIDRACFYHLVYSGRGSDISEQALQHHESREALDIICRRTRDFANRGLNKEILTVDNHVDGVYTLLKLQQEGSSRAEEVFKHLEWNGGGNHSSGVGIGDIDFFGDVHPDQFWMHYRLGNIKNRPFSEIWQDLSDPLLAGLRNRKTKLKGRCKYCKWLDLCGGALRVRADLVYHDPWAPDPACYLTDDEIGLNPENINRIISENEKYE